MTNLDVQNLVGSVHRNADSIAELDPLADEYKELMDLPRMLFRDRVEQLDLLLDQRDVLESDSSPRRSELLEFLQGVSAEDDALIGFGWGHAALHGRFGTNSQHHLTCREAKQ